MQKAKKAAKRRAKKKQPATVNTAPTSAGERMQREREEAAKLLKVGQRVRIVAGPDVGSEGEVEAIVGGYVTVDLGGVAGRAQFDAYKVEPVA